MYFGIFFWNIFMFVCIILFFMVLINICNKFIFKMLFNILLGLGCVILLFIFNGVGGVWNSLLNILMICDFLMGLVIILFMLFFKYLLCFLIMLVVNVIMGVCMIKFFLMSVFVMLKLVIFGNWIFSKIKLYWVFFVLLMVFCFVMVIFIFCLSFFSNVLVIMIFSFIFLISRILRFVICSCVICMGWLEIWIGNIILNCVFLFIVFDIWILLFIKFIICL